MPNGGAIHTRPGEEQAFSLLIEYNQLETEGSTLSIDWPTVLLLLILVIIGICGGVLMMDMLQ